MSKLRFTSILPAALSAILLAGCSGGSPKTHPASGKATYDDGSPLPKGTMLTIVSDPGGVTYTVSAIVGEGGAFKLKTVDKDGKELEGAPAGKYIVGVQAETMPSGADPPADFVPELLIEGEYTKPWSSGIVIDIKEGDNSSLLIKAGKKPAVKAKKG